MFVKMTNKLLDFGKTLRSNFMTEKTIMKLLKVTPSLKKASCNIVFTNHHFKTRFLYLFKT